MNLKKIIAIIVIFIFLSLAASPIISSNKIKQINENLEEVIELYLLRSEYYLYLDAEENIGSFIVKYSFPPL